jgi:hypothetical protein
MLTQQPQKAEQNKSRCGEKVFFSMETALSLPSSMEFPPDTRWEKVSAETWISAGYPAKASDVTYNHIRDADHRLGWRLPPPIARPDGGPLLGPRIVAPATLTSLPSGKLPPPAISSPIDNSGQNVQAAMQVPELCLPRTGTAVTDLVPDCQSSCWAHIPQTRSALATADGWMYSFLGHLLGRARRFLEELLNYASDHRAPPGTGGEHTPTP